MRSCTSSIIRERVATTMTSMGFGGLLLYEVDGQRCLGAHRRRAEAARWSAMSGETVSLDAKGAGDEKTPLVRPRPVGVVPASSSRRLPEVVR